MRVGHLNVTRPDWYDRQAAAVNQTYAAAPGATPPTVRWSYTVPTNKRALVLAAIAKALIVVNGSAGVLQRCSIGTNVGGSVAALCNADNTYGITGDMTQMVFNGLLNLGAGDIIIASTDDLLGGARVTNWYLSASITEFTAL